MKKKTRRACRVVDAKFGLPKGFTESSFARKYGTIVRSVKKGTNK